jgi:hypothetical protein
VQKVIVFLQKFTSIQNALISPNLPSMQCTSNVANLSHISVGKKLPDLEKFYYFMGKNKQYKQQLLTFSVYEYMFPNYVFIIIKLKNRYSNITPNA